MKIIIEPHADDAFLSLGGHIEKWNKQETTKIITVFSGTRKRAIDASLYSKEVGSLWSGLGLDETKDSFDLELLKKLIGEEDDLFIPLALTHPQHTEVRDKIESVYQNVFYYLDQPYALIQKNSNLISEKIKGLYCYSFYKPNSKKYRHIPLFKDQQKFFYYNPLEKLKEITEMIFVKSLPLDTNKNQNTNLLF
jgi:hypothetical protein